MTGGTPPRAGAWPTSATKPLSVHRVSTTLSATLNISTSPGTCDLGLPAEAVDVEAPGGLEVGHDQGDEADALVHLRPPASRRRGARAAEAGALAAGVVEVRRVQPGLVGGADARPLGVGDREPVGVAVAALVDHRVAEPALVGEAEPGRGRPRRLVEAVALPLVAAVAELVEDVVRQQVHAPRSRPACAAACAPNDDRRPPRPSPSAGSTRIRVAKPSPGRVRAGDRDEHLARRRSRAGRRRRVPSRRGRAGARRAGRSTARRRPAGTARRTASSACWARSARGGHRGPRGPRPAPARSHPSSRRLAHRLPVLVVDRVRVADSRTPTGPVIAAPRHGGDAAVAPRRTTSTAATARPAGRRGRGSRGSRPAPTARAVTSRIAGG